MIKIVKASAGSGKTFSLTKQYISLLFTKRDKFAYRHILAVTFTNKATEEMKNRILRELHILSERPEDSAYFADFVPSLFETAEEMRRTAKEMLCNILHDYGAFSVSTIDSFFQQTLRAFSREMGQFANYQVELDSDSIFGETIDNILDSLNEEDGTTLGWLTESAFEQVEQGDRYNLEKGLNNIMKRLKSEEHRVKVMDCGIDEDKVYSKENLTLIRNECNRFIAAFEDSVMEAAGEVVRTLGGLGLNGDEFAYKFVGQIYRYEKLTRGKEVARPTDTFFNRVPDRSKWFFKKDLSKYGHIDFSNLEGGLTRFCGLFEEDYRIYMTCRLIRAQLYGLGLAGELYHSYNELLKVQNILRLDDTNLLLKDIISGSDAPFIYEKTGVRYENFLLDEFQDTSVIQWDNILPLLKESEANGNENFIVGDVKQSIYRWRGSDWNLLAHGLQEALPDSRVENLGTNFRSLRRIVDFNNAFFRRVAGELDRKLKKEKFVEGLYDDVEQKCAKANRPDGGVVSVSFCDKDYEPQKVLDIVNEVLAAGGRYGDIAVLVRKNDEGAAVAEYLIEHGVDVLTDDSLKTKASLTVNRLVSLMTNIDNISNTVGSYLSTSLDIDTRIEYQSLAELCETLVRKLKDYDSRHGETTFSTEIAYVQSFVDAVLDYAAVHGNSLRGFLDYWNGTNPAISSPAGGDSVRILTVHKSKGLDFPYVIYPFAESLHLRYMLSNPHWSVPRETDALDSVVCGNVYDIDHRSKKVEDTLFDKEYAEELQKHTIDAFNVLYVALTRASKGMHIICGNVGEKFLSFGGGPWEEFSEFSSALAMFAKEGGGGLMECPDDGCTTFRVGEMPDFQHGEEDGDEGKIEVGYPSWAENADGRRRLVLSREYSDFFGIGEESSDGVSTVPPRTEVSARLRGTVLHDILAKVRKPDDLKPAVERAVVAGEIGSEDAPEALAFLEGRVARALERGWFPSDVKVYNERELLDVDGAVYRPDRVEIHPDGKVVVIDYKFARPKPEYVAQVRHYADMWRRMGCREVDAFLWYVFSDRVEQY